MQNERRQNFHIRRTTPSPFEEDAPRLFPFVTLNETKALWLEAPFPSFANEICQTVGAMHHKKTPAILQKMRRRVENIRKARRRFMRRGGDSLFFPKPPRAARPIRRIDDDGREMPERLLFGKLCIIGAKNGNDILFPISPHTLRRQIRQNGIFLYRRDMRGAESGQKERNRSRPRPELGESIAPFDGNEMRQEHGIDGKTKLVRALDDTHPVPHQIVKALPFAKLPRHFYSIGTISSQGSIFVFCPSCTFACFFIAFT